MPVPDAQLAAWSTRHPVVLFFIIDLFDYAERIRNDVLIGVVPEILHNVPVLRQVFDERAQHVETRAADIFLGIDQMGAFNVAIVAERLSSGCGVGRNRSERNGFYDRHNSSPRCEVAFAVFRPSTLLLVDVFSAT